MFLVIQHWTTKLLDFAWPALARYLEWTVYVCSNNFKNPHNVVTPEFSVQCYRGGKAAHVVVGVVVRYYIIDNFTWKSEEAYETKRSADHYDPVFGDVLSWQVHSLLCFISLRVFATLYHAQVSRFVVLL